MDFKKLKKVALTVPFASMILTLLIIIMVLAWVDTSPTNATTPYSTDGIWSGKFDINGNGNFDFTALYINGEAVAISQDANVVYSGKVSNNNEHYQSKLTMYIKNKNLFDEVDLYGTFENNAEINLHFKTLAAKDQGNLKLSYQKEMYEKMVTIDLIEGNWILYHGFTIIKFDIKDNGVIHGADTTGCAYEGEIKPIKPDVNAYQLHIFLSSCNHLNGEMGGMAYLTSSIEENDTLNLHLFNEDSGLFFPIVRNDNTRAINQPAKL